MTDTSPNIDAPVIVIGGGMAGLACAYRLVTAGLPVTLLESMDYVGGRVRTFIHDGLPIDDGFQVLFRAYPETHRLMDDVGFPTDLIRPYDRGAICYSYGAPFTFSTNPLAFARFPLMTAADKARLGVLGATLLATSIADIWNDTEDEPTEAYLRRFGFSVEAIEQFFRPFFAGILLNAALDTSSKDFRFIYKMLASGETVTTRDGLGAIPEAIATAIRARGGTIRTGVKVEALLPSSPDGAPAVQLTTAAGTEQMTGSAVVLAASAPQSRDLLKEIDGAVAARIPTKGLPSTTVAWHLPRALYPEKKILVNVDALSGKRRLETGFHLAAQITNATHPDGSRNGHLLIVASIAEACADEHYRTETLPREALATIGKWFPRSGIERDAELVVTHYTEFGQFAQPPGTREQLPTNLTQNPRLVLAGEYTEHSSIEGAVVSGMRAAEIVRNALARTSAA
jgi:phytoene dehydrogenase-like protein